MLAALLTPVAPVAGVAALITGAGPAVKKDEVKVSINGFPSVSLQTQRFRDMDRRKILQEELDIEKKTLGMVMANGAAADTIHRHRMNVDALEREIRNVK